MNINDILKDRLKEERKNYGLNQKQLADKIGKSLSAVSGYETGDILPPIDILNKLADIFDCSVDYLVGRSPHRDYRIESEEVLGQTVYFGVLKSAEKLSKEEKIRVATQLLNDANKE